MRSSWFRDNWPGVVMVGLLILSIAYWTYAMDNFNRENEACKKKCLPHAPRIFAEGCVCDLTSEVR